jgi:ribonucleoside-diphosphate reductase alpha chain
MDVPKKNGNGNGHGNRLTPDAKPIDDGAFTSSPLQGEDRSEGRSAEPSMTATPTRLAAYTDPLSQQGTNMQTDAPACDVCGSITVRSGTCYKCLNCGNSMGCS